jgi:hypothetical protein
MLNAINNINSISKLIEKSDADQIIRATNTKLKTDNDIKTYFYIRNSKIDQLWQKLTDWTDGAKAKQFLAKEEIIKNLNVIKGNLDFDKRFSDPEKRKNVLSTIDKLITTVGATEKDITAAMIKNDLSNLNSFLRTYEPNEINKIDSKTSSEGAVNAKDEVVAKSKNNISGNQHGLNEEEGSKGGDIAQSEAESDLNSIKINSIVSNRTEPVSIDLEDGVAVIMKSTDLENFENNIKANISKNISLFLDKFNNVSSIDVTEVVFDSEEPSINERHFEEPNYTPAESDTTSTAAPPLIIESDNEVAEVASDNLPNTTSSVFSSKAETNASAEINPYLESLQSEWTPAEDGYYQVSKPFYITGGVATTSMLAQAYLIPAAKELEFAEETKVQNRENEGRVIQGNHILHKHLNTDTERPTRPYLKLPIKSPNTTLFGPKKIRGNNAQKERVETEFRKELFSTYIVSIEKLYSEYKNLNNGRELESLVIVPIAVLVNNPSSIEIDILTSVVVKAQSNYPNLKIHISAPTAMSLPLNHESLNGYD